jgi:iron complex outermembrane receptor protein
MSPSFRASGLAALALTCPVAASAEDAAPQIVVIGQREPTTDPAKRPGGAAVIAAAEFEDRVAVSLRDALADAAGIYTQPRFGQEVRLSIRGSGLSRGFHMRGLTLLQDGVPINLADDNGDFQELDPQVFERIEVYRGGNALRFGGSTLGGAINAVTPTGRTAPGIALRVDGGSFDTVRGRASGGFSDDRGDVFVAVTGDSSDGDRAHAERQALRVNGNVGLRLSNGIGTRLYATINRIRQRLPGALTSSLVLTAPETSLPANIIGDQARDIDSLRLQSRTTVALESGSLAFGAYLNAKDLYHPIFQVIDQKSLDRGAFASLDVGGSIAGLPVEATLGTTARVGRVDARQFVNVGGRRGAPTARNDQTARTINSYGEARVTALPGVTLIAGGIYSHGRRALRNRLVPANSAARSYGAFAPKIGILWAPKPAVQLYANYNRSVEFPGFGELVQAPLAGFVPLDPQRAWTAEIGTRGTRGIATWDVSLYRADIRGELLQFTVDPNTPAATFNARRTRHSGVEAALDLRLTPWLRLRQTYLHSNFRFRGDAQYGDNRLPVIPRDVYRAALRLGDGATSVTPSLEWVPTGPWADYRNTRRTPGYALIGIGAEARLHGRVSLFVDARNLTGKQAIGDLTAVVLATPASAIYYPVERRAIYGGIRAGF